MRLHPTALVDPTCELAEEVEIGAYAVVEGGVSIGAGCVIAEHAIVRRGSVLGSNCRVDAHAVVGGLPQDLHFDPATASGVRLGDGVVLREGVTISRATRPGSFTEIGDGCFLMASSHVAHDCRLGRKVILANGVLLAGHVQVGDSAFLGGGALVHQFIRIGAVCMVSGGSRVAQDLPPFCMTAERNELIGLNLVGLQRNGFSREDIRSIKLLFRAVFDGTHNPRRRAEALLAEADGLGARGRAFLEFISEPGRKGLMRPSRAAGTAAPSGE